MLLMSIGWILLLSLFVAAETTCVDQNCSEDESQCLLQSHRIQKAQKGPSRKWRKPKSRSRKKVVAIPEKIQHSLEQLYRSPFFDRLSLSSRTKKKIHNISGFPQLLYSSSSSTMSGTQAQSCLNELSTVTAFDGIPGSVAALADSTYPYNADFVQFTGAETTAYQAINAQLQIYLTQSDLRASYVDLANDAGMPLVVLTEIGNLQSTSSFRSALEPGCDDDCFDTVANQLKLEVSYLSLLYNFFAVYVDYYSDSNQNMYNAISDVQDWLSMADTQLIPPPAKKSWLEVMFSSMDLSASVLDFGLGVFEATETELPYAAFLGIFSDALECTTYGAKTAQAADESSDTVTYGGVTFTSTSMTNGESAQALVLKQSFSDMYSGYEQVAAWQMDQIASDWGKLQGFVILNAQCPIGTTVVTPVLDEMYRAFQWIGLTNLMPSKYKVGYERNYQRESRRRVSGACWSPSHVETRTATASGANSFDTVDLASTTPDSNECFYIQSPRKMTAAIRNYWLSEIDDDTKQPSTEFYSYFDDMITYYINPAFNVNFSSSLDAIAAACLYLPPARSSLYSTSLTCDIYGINLTVEAKSDCNTGGCLSGDCNVLDLMSTSQYPYDPYENTNGGSGGNYSVKANYSLSCCVPYMSSSQATSDGCKSLFCSTHKEGQWCSR
jgi:hypothetical protein